MFAAFPLPWAVSSTRIANDRTCSTRSECHYEAARGGRGHCLRAWRRALVARELGAAEQAGVEVHGCIGEVSRATHRFYRSAGTPTRA
jgi:hypothetical protein